ncbi:MAG: hypothetical protein J6A89_06755 [Clostridia bacterium]|nr:hypothetical protein [Clostridia bacterium]
MKEKSKKILSILIISIILCSAFAVLFSKKASASKEITETTINPTDLLTIYAESAAGIANKTEWAEKNGFDISTIKEPEKYVLNFEKATDSSFNNFNDGNILISDATAVLQWYAILSAVLTGNETLSEENPLAVTFKELGINTKNLKLTASVNSDGHNYELSTEKNDYSMEEIVEIFEGDIIDNGTIIEFANDGVKAVAKLSDGTSKEISNIVKIEVKEKNLIVTDKEGNSVEAIFMDYETYTENLSSSEFYVKTENVKISKDGKEIDLFSNSSIKDSLARIEFNKNIEKFVINYRENYSMDVEDVYFTVIDGDNNTWYFALGTDMNFYLVNDKAFAPEDNTAAFDTTIEYSAIIDSKEVGGTDKNGTFKPNYDKDNPKKDADVTATVKSTNGDDIVTVDGKELDPTGKPNEDGWYYSDPSDKTTISKQYPFSKYDNSTDNGMVTETVILGNEAGLTSNEKPSIKWPFRIIDVTYDPEKDKMDENTQEVTVTITTNLPMDPAKLPDGWSIVPGTDNHKAQKTYKRGNGDDINEDITVFQNGTGEKDDTKVSITWPEKNPPVNVKAGESIMILGAIALLGGVAIIAKKKIHKK